MASNQALRVVLEEIKQGNYVEARKLLHPMLQDMPNAEVYYLASRAATDRTQAAMFLRQALKRNPEYKPAQRDLERIRAAIEAEHSGGKPVPVEGIVAAWTSASSQQAKPASEPETYAPPVLAFLPGLPSSVLAMRYKASNEMSHWALITLLAMGTLAAVAIGLLASVVSTIAMPPLLDFIMSVLADAALSSSSSVQARMTAFTIIMLALIGVGVAAALAYIISLGLWLIVRYSRARSPIWVGVVAFLSAALGYALYAYMELIKDGVIDVTSSVTRLFEVTAWWFPLAVAADLLVFVGWATYSTYKRVANTPYDENNHRWYTKPPQRLIFAAEAAPALVSALQLAALDQLAGYRAQPHRSDRYPCLQLELQPPPVKGEPYNLRVRAYWQENQGRGWQRRKVEKHKDWFQVMLPYELGRSFKAVYKWR